jgi:polyisoprenoid-binding protein YceI
VRLLAHLGLMLGASLPLAAQHQWLNSDLKHGTLSFDGKSTLGDFTGTTTTIRGQMLGTGAITAVRGWVEAPVKTLKTENDRRDRDLIKTMEADIYPNIRFELGGVAVQWERGDSLGVTLDGQFVIHGVSRPEKVNAVVLRAPDGIHVSGSLPMNLHDYKVDNLKRFLVLKMDPDIVVHIALVF